MKIKPKIEPLNLAKFLKEKSKQFDIPVSQLEEMVRYGVLCKMHEAGKSGGLQCLANRGIEYYKELRAKQNKRPVHNSK